MKRKTVKILLRTTANEVEKLRNRIEEAEQKIIDMEEERLKNHENLIALQNLSDENNQKIEALLKCNSFKQVAATKGDNIKVNRTDLEGRDKEFLRKINIIKQAQSILRSRYEEQIKKKSVWQKLLPIFKS